MSFTQIPSCLGCIQNQPNQLAHMNPGGCLYSADEDEEVWETDSDSSEEFEPLNLEPAFSEAVEQAASEAAAVGNEEEPEAPKVDVSKPLVEPLFALPCGFQFPECAICYEQIEMVNVTVTTCGHTFHSSCAFKALENNDCCPMCRHQLLAEPVDDESEGEYEESVDEEGSDDEGEEGDDEEEEVKVNLEQLAGKLTNMGYTMTDILKFFVADVKSQANEAKYDDQFISKMENDINGVIEGTISLAHRDARSYAAVVAAPKPQQAQRAPVQVQVQVQVQAQAQVQTEA
jgi:hypothetical protein